MYIVSAYSTDRYESSLFEPVPFNNVENAVRRGANWLISFVAQQCGLDATPKDDEILDIEDNFEPCGTFDEGNLELKDGTITVGELRKALVEENTHYFYAATKDSAGYHIDISVEKVDMPTD